MSHEILRKALDASTETLASKRQVRAIVSTDQADRVGDIVVQAGISLANFLRTRTVLWNHDQDQPIAQCASIGLAGGNLQALVQFPAAGVSAKSDEVLGLIQAGVINGVSIGFIPTDQEPIDKTNPRKGMRIKTSELLEFSFVSVPCNAGALISARSVPAGSNHDRLRQEQRRRQVDIAFAESELTPGQSSKAKRQRQLELESLR